MFFFFKQKTAYDMRISDWSSDVCSSDLLTIDGPLAGTADTTRYRYDGKRRIVGVVGPDPDGAGTRKHLAQRATYNSDWQVTLTEAGNVNSQSDADWAAMTVAEASVTNYDANRSEAHTSELQSLMSISYAVLLL